MNFGRYDWPMYNEICEILSCTVSGLPYSGPGMPWSPHIVACRERRVTFHRRKDKSLLGSAFQGVTKLTQPYSGVKPFIKLQELSAIPLR